jgi:hypothetical protein
MNVQSKTNPSPVKPKKVQVAGKALTKKSANQKKKSKK